ncbi:MAG: heme-binding domain-containing protein [Saprospiraceae bacterium]|nr:heme-binding domain-containing protein [Saprospiraceae bacterium]
MKKAIKIILIGLLVLFIGMQFIRPSHQNPPVDPQQDFLAIAQPSAEISTMLKNACYDCHSHETKYPWYSNVAPVCWILQNHIIEGREHLNFSKWGTPEAFGEEPEEAFEEIIEVIQKGEMPLWDYKMMHPEARLSEADKNQLINWVENQSLSGNAPVSDNQPKGFEAGEEPEDDEEEH